MTAGWHFCGDNVAARPPTQKRFIEIDLLGNCVLDSAIVALPIASHCPVLCHNGWDRGVSPKNNPPVKMAFNRPSAFCIACVLASEFNRLI